MVFIASLLAVAVFDARGSHSGTITRQLYNIKSLVRKSSNHVIVGRKRSALK